MKKEYRLEGLDCPNCAAKIEAALKEIAGVRSAAVNFMSGIAAVEIADDYAGDIAADVVKTVHKFEPDVAVSEKQAAEALRGQYAAPKKSEKKGKIEPAVIFLIAGAVVLGVGILLEYLKLPWYAYLPVYIASYALLGWEVLFKAARNITKGQIFDENFLMAVASIGAFAIGEYAEAAAVMLFYGIGELFQNAAVRKSKKSITALMDIRPDYANLITDGAAARVNPESVMPGDVIIVKPGEKIPLDGRVTAGEAMLDTAALTGESVPRKAGVGDTVLSGCINQSGVLTITVTKTFGESAASKIIDLVENASSKKAKTENFITKFAKIYTPAVVAAAVLIAVIPPLFSGEWTEWINRALIFLVISCPCALVISIPLGFFGGIGGASRQGILIKGGNYLEALNRVDTVVFDKTGTLTEGVFDVVEVEPAADFTAEQVLELAAYAESFSNHPIARSVVTAYGKTPDTAQVSDYTEVSGHGVTAKVNGGKVAAGNYQLMRRENIACNPSDGTGTRVYVALDGQFAGSILIADRIKPDSAAAIAGLKANGIKTVMLTGDNAAIAESVASQLGIDAVYAQLLPAGKVAALERLDAEKRKGGKLIFVGDGINDAPVLARADIGIAMGALGSDAAIEAADVVFMTDEPSKTLAALKIAQKTKRVVWQNIIFALGVKAAFMVLGLFGIATMWEAVFADVGVALLAILNAMRVMRIKRT